MSTNDEQPRISSVIQRPHYRLHCMYRGPGPAYQLKKLLGTSDHCITKPQAPAYTIGIPYRGQKNDSPGPTYNYDANLTNQGIQQPPKFSFSGRPRTKAPEILPGPGAYESHTVKDPLPRISMGQKLRTRANDVPPPNAYNVRSGIGSWSATERRPPSCVLKSRQAVGSTYYSTFKAAVPGPSAYSAAPEARVRSCSIKSRCPVKDYNTVKDNPGPGAYDVKGPGSFAGPRRGFSMGIRHSEFEMPLITCHDNIMY